MSSRDSAVHVPTRSALSRTVQRIVEAAGSTTAAALALTAVVAWVVVGAVTGFGPHWLDALVAVTALITFAMVFLIQHTTDRQLRAVLLKLDEVLRAEPHADEAFIAAERRPLHEQEELEEAVQDPQGEIPGGPAQPGPS